MAKYSIRIDSAYAGCDPTFTTVHTPLSPQLGYELGTAYPTAQQLANHFAAEFCDGGTVTVTGPNGDRGRVARTQVPA